MTLTIHDVYRLKNKRKSDDPDDGDDDDEGDRGRRRRRRPSFEEEAPMSRPLCNDHVHVFQEPQHSSFVPSTFLSFSLSKLEIFSFQFVI